MAEPVELSKAERKVSTCEGTTSKMHPHAFTHRVSIACANKARWRIAGLGVFCGRCVRLPIVWAKL